MKKLLILISIFAMFGCAHDFASIKAQSGVADKTTGDQLTATEFTAVKNTADTADALATTNAAAISVLQTAVGSEAGLESATSTQIATETEAQGYVTSHAGEADPHTGYVLESAIGSTVQAYDADLTTYAGITPSANVQTMLGSASNQAIRNNIGPFDQGMGTNWIVDPDFRLQVAGANHWYTVVNAAHDTPLYGAYGEGTKKGVKFTHDGNTYCIAWTTKVYPAKDNDIFYTNFRYFLSSDYEDSADRGVGIQIQTLNAAGEALGVYGVNSEVATLNAWATASGTMTITDDDTQYINVALYIYDAGSAGVGYAQVEDVFLSRLEAPPWLNINDTMRFRGSYTVAEVIGGTVTSPAQHDLIIVNDSDTPCDISVGSGSYQSWFYRGAAAWVCMTAEASGIPGWDYTVLTAEPDHQAGQVWVADADTWNPCNSTDTTNYLVYDDGTAFQPMWEVDGTPIIQTAVVGTPREGWFYWFENTSDGGADDPNDEDNITGAYQVYRTSASYVTTRKADGSLVLSNVTIPVSTSGDQTRTVGQLGLKADEDLLVTHGGASGEVQDEVGISLLDHIVCPFDPEFMYDTTTNHIVPLITLGDDYPHGITITEWSIIYLNGDPTTEIDLDLICDTTPDWNPAAGATVMDALDTTAGTATADSGFDSATCANGSKLYLRFGADPVDSGEIVLFELWGYKNED